MEFKLAWRNIWRNPRRSIQTMSAVAFPTLLLVFMLSWQFGSYTTMINASVKIQTGHLQIQAEGYPEKRDIRKVVSDPEDIGEILERLAMMSIANLAIIPMQDILGPGDKQG